MKVLRCLLLIGLSVTLVGCGGSTAAPEAPKTPSGLGEPMRDKDGKLIETPAGGAPAATTPATK